MEEKKVWVVTVNMGYGHQRTAYPLDKIAFGEIIKANSYQGIPEKDKRIWETTRKFYEFISKFKRIPLIGNFVFNLYDKFQKIPAFYPERDLSKPILSLKKIFSLIRKGWGKDLILKLKNKPFPLIATFFTSAFMAESFSYPQDIFCVICDADVSRSWVSLNPKESKIKYFAPNTWVRERLRLYGVREENIFLTGYPLPLENIGTEKMETAKMDLGKRILNLDVKGKYQKRYKPLIEKYVGELPQESDHPLTILFSIGGAGAQKKIAFRFVRSLSKSIKEGKLRVILSAGIRKEVRDYFLKQIRRNKLENCLGKNIEIICEEKIKDYFRKFNQKLRETDILWTKPSELSFYSGLGLPIIIAPSIGSQEDLNRKWLLRIGAGILQENPRYANQWLFDYLESGRFAEAAMRGFISIEKLGTYNIMKIVSN